MKKTWILLVLSTLIFASAMLGILTAPAVASPNLQVQYFTPTAQPDGKIIYIVKDRDTCISISLLNSVSLDTLRSLNNLTDANCSIQVGQKLLLATVAPLPSNTPGPSPTPTFAPPTNTPTPGKGQICVYLFNDINGDAMPQDNESPLAGGAISLTDRSGKVSQTGNTLDDGTPTCFKDLGEGDYNVSIAVPQGYNPTTATNRSLSLRAGDISTLDFGAQISQKLNTNNPTQTSTSPILGILGGLLLLGGVGLGVWVRFLRR